MLGAHHDFLARLVAGEWDPLVSVVSGSREVVVSGIFCVSANCWELLSPAFLASFVLLLTVKWTFSEVSALVGDWFGSDGSLSPPAMFCFSNIISMYLPCSSIRNCSFLWLWKWEIKQWIQHLSTCHCIQYSYIKNPQILLTSYQSIITVVLGPSAAFCHIFFPFWMLISTVNQSLFQPIRLIIIRS